MRADEAHQQELEHQEYLEECQKKFKSDKDYQKWLDELDESKETNSRKMVG